MDRTGQTIVVLGGSGGLGRGLVRKYALDGASVVVADIDQDELDRVSADLADQGLTSLFPVRTDISKPEAVESLAQETKSRFGQIAAVINTVGVIRKAPTWAMSMDDWRWQMDVNFWGVLHVIRSFTPILIEQGRGHLVSTVSTLSLTSASDSPAYLASKHAALSLCEALQQDLRAAGSPVLVSALIPGAIRSPIFDGARNRQAEYGGSESVADLDQEYVTDQQNYLDQFGADPDVLAEIIVDQLDRGRFYVFGRATDIRYAQERLQGLEQGTLAPPSFVREAGPGARATQSTT